jgi:putative DNA primase/helicase
MISEVHIEPVPSPLLHALAAESPSQSETSAPPKVQFQANQQTEFTSRLLVAKWLNNHGIAFRVKDLVDAKRRTVYVLKQCPFDPSHADPDSCIMQDPDGKMSAQCFHNSCADRGWQEFKQKIGIPRPEHYDPQLGQSRSLKETNSKSNGQADVDDQAADQVNEAADDPHRLARLFLRDYHRDHFWTLRFYRDEWVSWDGSSWQHLPTQELRGRLCKKIKQEFDRINKLAIAFWEQNQPAADKGKKSPRPEVRKVTIKLLNDTVQALASVVLLSSKTECPSWLDGVHDDLRRLDPSDVLVCANGLVHLPTLVVEGGSDMQKHTPCFFTRNALAYDFNDLAPTPNLWLEFLGQLWPAGLEDAIRTLQEWFGYCLTPDTRQQKILLIVGPKRSGKGTIARVLRRLVGVANCCSPTLASMGTNFGLWPLLNKTVAFISDARLSGRSDTAIVIERLLSISGEDAQTIDRKYLDPVTEKLATRLVIMTNELPKLQDASGALAGRMILLPLTESFYGREDPSLTDKLLMELPSILLWAVAGWKQLRDRGHFVQPAAGLQLLRELEDLTSLIGAFVRECCDVRPDAKIPVQELFTAWGVWCVKKGRKDGGLEQQFGRDLRTVVPKLIVRQPRGEEGRQRVYEGVTIKRG